MGKKRDREIADSLGLLGSAQDIYRVIAHAVMDKGGTMDHLRRIVNEPELQAKIAELVIAVEEPKPAVKESEKFTVSVIYNQPCFDDLHDRYHWVNHEYHGCEFKAIDCCKEVSRENREVEFEYVHLGRYAPPCEVLAEIDRLGFRPALYEELLSFAEQFPDEQKERCIVAFGSEALLNNSRRHAYLWRDGFGRILNLGYADYVCHEKCWFLVVRKDASDSVGKEPAKVTSEEELPQDHYRVHVSYAPMPSMEELKNEWGEEITDIFHRWPVELHPSCQDMDRTPGDRIFFLHNVGHEWDSDGRIIWGETRRNAVAPNGYRPATLEETYEFAKARPELADFVGLGSIAMVAGSDRCVAGVRQAEGKRFFSRYLYDSPWSQGKQRVLFVAK